MQIRRALAVLGFAAVLGVIAQPVQAQFGDIQRTLFRGAYYAGNHTIISNPQGGPMFDNNLFDQRLEYNRTGQGWTYEQFHFFGPDSWDNPNTLDLGPLKVQLGRDPTVITSPQPVGIHNRIGFTTTLIPELTFNSQTGQRNFDIFSGQTSFVPVPVHYNVTFDAGVQKFEWTGNMLVQTNGSINALGFYDLQMRMMNVGNYTADGFADHDEQVTDFDTGPVNVSGQILMDALAGLAQSVGASGEAVTPRTVSATSARGKTVDELMASLQAGEKISDDDMAFLMTQMFQTAFLNDPLGFMQNGLPTHVPGFEALSVQVSEDQPDPPVESSTVPEPGTLLLIVSIIGLLWFLEPRLQHRSSY